MSEFKEGVKVIVKKKVSSQSWGTDTFGAQNNNKQKLEQLLARLTKQKQKEAVK